MFKPCLYDFNKNQLHWLNNDTTLFVQRILSNKETISTEAEKALLPFIEANIISDKINDNSNYNIESILPANGKIEFAWIELTDKCNLKCIHCYNSSDVSRKNSLSLEGLMTIVDELVELDVKLVQLIGREPLLIKESLFFEMVDYVAENFEDFEIFCNGTLLNESIIKKLSKYPNIRIAVSLYSFIETEHDKITGNIGSQRKTINSINLLKKYEIPVRYVGILIDNLDIGKHPKYSENHKQGYIRLTGRANLNLYNKSILKNKLITLESFTNSISKEQVINLHKERCFSRSLYISSSLDVFPCVMERRIKHGNLRDEKLANLLNHNILNYSKKEVEACKDCEFRYACMDCRPDSCGGNFNDKPWFGIVLMMFIMGVGKIQMISPIHC